MPNTNFPGGFDPVKYTNGRELQDETGAISATNNAIGYNDPLEMHTDGYLRQAATTATKIVGVAAEYKAANSGGNIKYYPAAGLLMRSQSDDDSIDAQTDFDQTYAITVGNADTTTGRSIMEIDGNAAHATDYPIILRRVAEPTDSIGNALGLNVALECVFNPAVIW